MAAATVDNSATVDSLNDAVDHAVEHFIRGVSEECRSRSS
jgi:hypothetical protein